MRFLSVSGCFCIATAEVNSTTGSSSPCRLIRICRKSTENQAKTKKTQTVTPQNKPPKPKPHNAGQLDSASDQQQQSSLSPAELPNCTSPATSAGLPLALARGGQPLPALALTRGRC